VERNHLSIYQTYTIAVFAENPDICQKDIT